MLAMSTGFSVLRALHRIPMLVPLTAHFNDAADEARGGRLRLSLSVVEFPCRPELADQNAVLTNANSGYPAGANLHHVPGATQVALRLPFVRNSSAAFAPSFGMKYIFLAFAILVASSAAWHYRGAFSPQPYDNAATPKAIVFDNGSVRDYTSTVPASGTAASTQQAPGALRKCVKGSETVYTNFACPPKFKEKAVASDRVTVLTDQGVAAPSSRPATPEGRPVLREVLDGGADESAKDRVMQRALGTGSR